MLELTQHSRGEGRANGLIIAPTFLSDVLLHETSRTFYRPALFLGAECQQRQEHT
jgi:hypothetical protein